MNIQENKRYASAGFIIDIDQHTVEANGSVVNVRPRTFTLLKLLLMQSKQVVSKEVLLESIWDDVVVDEQVLFQSISEIRQLFKNPTVIKTYPRKGYIWTCDVEEVKDGFFSRHKKALILICALLMSAALGAGFVWHHQQKNHTDSTSAPQLQNKVPSAQELALQKHDLSGSVLILPIKTSINSIEHQWVNLGGMDQLISLLRPSELAVVRDTEVVLWLMQEAQLKRDYQSDEVHKLFQHTQASAIVESLLTGNINEYRLLYKIHQSAHVSQGLIEAQSIDQALILLAEELSGKLNTQAAKNKFDYSSDYRNALLVSALELMEQENYKDAQALLKTLLETEKDNLIARRKLAESLFHLGQAEQALNVLDEAASIALAKQDFNLSRIYYWQAVIENSLQNHDAALSYLQQADAVVAEDWLYAAYIAELRGILFSQTGKVEQGISSYKNALSNYGNMFCPNGRGRTYLHLAHAYFNLGQKQQAEEQFEQAQALMQNYQLDRLQAYSDNMQNLLAN
ncbi:winged helix-turn-helix domain-containing protein [Agaribacterium sp. ZY112]|uniref:winged helix-turn-helix domain-containing protein n=1 Tax=Agaribacterium sp. ZY112 TaxID=3233574 RepID=UPI0035232876